MSDEVDDPIRGATQGANDIEPDVLNVVAVPYRGTVRLSIDHWVAGGDEIEISERSARELHRFLRDNLSFLRGQSRSPVGRSWRGDGTSRLTSTPLALDVTPQGEYWQDKARTMRLKIAPRTPTYAQALATIELDAAGAVALIQRLEQVQRRLAGVPGVG